ncbi:glycosyltransferase [Alloiococcus sp. CFN-8]|uniref:glycosyltransferase n=1 Tax=Alloiococcus sp. CFN-8 TaxID=3416081 RepID=UPI003CF65A99
MMEPNISFIIVNYNGRIHLKECFNTINALNYPKDKLEIIMVDNGSTDGSIEFVRKNFPRVKILKNEKNLGFAKPNNQGARIATGEYLALINNDMRISSDWLRDMLGTLEAAGDDSYACVGSKILNWDGTKLDFAGGAVNFMGFGYQDDYDLPIYKANEKYKTDRDILFACGGALLIKKDVFLEVGGFDEDYFAYYEDTDLGWRLWIMGYKVRFCAKAVCYHKHNSTSKSFNQNKMKALFERNALYSIYKNYSDKNFNVILSSILLATQRLQMDLNVNASSYDIKALDSNEQFINNNDENFTTLVAINELLKNIPTMAKKREFIQERRKVQDEDLAYLFTRPLLPFPLKYFHDHDYLGNIQKVVDTFNIDRVFDTKFRREILLIAGDKVGKKMAGPGIRYWEFAKELSNHNNVLLAIPNPVPYGMEKEHLSMVEYNPQSPQTLASLAMNSDIIILHGTILEQVPELKEIAKSKILIVDIYDPFSIENLEIYKNKDMRIRLADNEITTKVQIEQLELGDYFICASDSQMNFWIGMLTALKKVTPQEYDLSSDLSKLIGMVPFGISSQDPISTRKAMKEKVPNLKPEDKVFIWGGGVWNWFDPITLIKAIYEISKVRDDIKLFFLGIKHPNPAVPEMEMTNKAIALAEELGIINTHVFFNMDWVDYEDRQNFLMESYGGVSCHFNNLETRFSFRTRILDYLWARLPIIATEGDFFASEVEKHGLGITVAYEDVEEMKIALIRLSDDKAFYEECVNNINVYREDYKWDRVTKPLVDFCDNPIKKPLLASLDRFYEIEQTARDSITGEFVDGERIGQSFKCRYPNLSAVEVFVATYQRKNNHGLTFKLYDGETDVLIIEKSVRAEDLQDNTWLRVDIEPILNSEGRRFYFYIESQGATVGNSITLWKSGGENTYGDMFRNEEKEIGNLTFRTEVIFSKNPLADGIELPSLNGENDPLAELSIEELQNLINNARVIRKSSGGVNPSELASMKRNIADLLTNVNNINNWIVKRNFRLRFLMKPYKLLQRLLRR